MAAKRRRATKGTASAEAAAPAVSLQFEYFNDFIKAFSANISQEGVFVETSEPFELGSTFALELRLGDDFTLVEGDAEVVWVRREAGDTSAPAGMGASFARLDDSSRNVIQRMVDQRLEQGLPPFELQAPEGAEQAARSESPPPAAAGDPGQPKKKETAEPAVAEGPVDNAELEAALASLAASQAAATENAHLLERALADGKKSASALAVAQEELEATHAAAAAQEKRLKDLQAEGERTATALASAEEARTALSAELQSAQKRIQELESAKKATEATLQSENEALRARLGESEGALGAAAEQAEESASSLDEARRDLASTRKQLESLQTDLKAEGVRVARLRGERDEVQQQRDEARREADAVAAAAAAAAGAGETVQRGPQPLRWGTVALSTAVFLLTVALVYSLSTRGSAPSPAAAVAAAGSGSGSQDAEPEPEAPPEAGEPDPEGRAAPPTGQATPSGDSEPPAPAAPAAADPLLVPTALSSWAQAWSDQSVEDYLSAYSAEFQTPNGLDRAAWEAQRRDRLLRPASILVTLSQLEVAPSGEGRVRASFDQAYESDTFADSVRKTMDLVWEGGRWRILQEVAE